MPGQPAGPAGRKPWSPLLRAGRPMGDGSGTSLGVNELTHASPIGDRDHGTIGRATW